MSRFAHSGAGWGAARTVPEYKQMEISAGMTEEVYVTHIRDPDHFYVQLSKQSSDLDVLMDKLHEVYDGMEEVIQNPVLGCPCVAQFSEDNGWYRAVITGILQRGMLEVRFVDYGNSECVSNTKVKDITQEFLSQPVMGLHCGLTGVATTQGFWSPEHTVQFEDLALDQTFTATFRGYKLEPGILSVELVSSSGKNINKEFGMSTNTTCVEEVTVVSQRQVQVGQGDADLQISLSIKSDNPHGASSQVYSNGEEGGPLTVDLSPGQNEIIVVYAFTPGEFWCQLVKFADRLSALSSQLNQEYSRLQSGELAFASPKPGMFCAAKFCEDMMWYRGQVRSVGRGEIEVYFIDYGNTEKITPDLVKDLKPGLKNEPAQAIKCMLSNLRNSSGAWSDAAAEAFESLTLDKHLLAVSDGRVVDGKVPVKLKDPVEGYDIAEKLAESNHGTVAKSSIPRVPAHVAKQPTFAKPDISVPSQRDVFLSWTENPSLFWVHLSNRQTELDNLVEKVQEIYTNQATPVRSILPGMAVVAQFSEDKAWYRAVVQKMRGKKVEVLFVDFGNTDTVSADSLKEVNSAVASIPMLAIQCSLTGIRPPATATSWTEDAKSILEDVSKDGAVCRFLSLQNGYYAVNLTVGGKDVASELVAAGVARSTPGEGSENKRNSPATTMRFKSAQSLSVGQTEKALISHIDSLSSFWCQLVSTLPQLDSVMEELEGFYSQGNGIQLPNPQPGLACVTKFSEDLLWYRAVVRSVDVSGISVHFVDYGNSEIASPSSVCSIGSQYLDLPPQAVHCKLSLPAGTDDMIDKFHELVSEKEVTLKAVAVDGSVVVVELLESGRSITNRMKDLFPSLQNTAQSQPTSRGSAASRLDYQVPKRPHGKTEKVFVSFTESPQMFCVHYANIDSQLEAIKDKLTASYGSGSQPPLASPRSGQPCCALYAEDGAWYRGRVVATHGAQITVQFVDYGNADVVTAENVKPLTADFLSPGPLALECSLENVSPNAGTWTDDAIAYFETLTTEKEISCEFKEGKDVSLMVDGTDVAQKMEEKGFLKIGSSVSSNSEISLIYNSPTVPGQPNPAYVTHVENDGIFYIQLASAGALVEELSERLQELYNNPDATTSLSSVQKGAPCCAKFTEDESWYRATIEDIKGSSVVVRFVDFGNTDCVNLKNIQTLEADFAPIPPLAFQCKVQGLSSWKGDQKQKFTDLTLDKEVTVKFLTKTAPYTVEMNIGSQNLMEQLLPDLTSPPRKLFTSPTSPPRRSEPPFQKKTTSPQLSGTPWHESVPSSPDSPPDKNPFSGSSSRREGNPFGNARSRKGGGSFGSAPPRQESRGFGSGPPRKESSFFGSSSPRKERSPFGSGPRQESHALRKTSGFSPPSKSVAAAAPPPTLEKIPPQEQVYASQSVPEGTIRSCISHVEKNDIYVQQTKEINNICAYSNKIKRLPTNEVSAVVGLACGALFSDDGVWYRAKITSVSGNQVSVVFVDFGNSDTVDSSKLKQLSRELLAVPPFAYRCHLEGIGSLTQELTNILAEEVADKELDVKFKSQEIPYTAHMCTPDGKNLSELLCPTKFLNQSAPSQMVMGVVSNIASDGTFYVQLLKDQDSIQQLEEDLKMIYAKGTIDNPESFETGKPCCARFPDDQTWQRGVVKSVDGNCIEVNFVDIGMSETVKSYFVQLLPRKFMFTPPYAYECILKDFTSWTEEQRKKFINMTDGKTMNIQFVSQAAPFKVEMTRSVGLELLGEKPAVKRVSVSSGSSRAESVDKDLPVTFPGQKLPEGETGYVSFVDSNGTFYLQLASEEEKLGEITEAIQAEYGETGGERVFGLKVGMFCCAKFTEDDAWYRAEVISIDKNQITVRFLDYGNTDLLTIERVAVLTSSNMSVHPLAYKCSLDGVKSWTESLIEKFDEQTKEKTLTVSKISTEVAPFLVELRMEDKQNLKDILTDEIAEANENAESGFKWSSLVIGKKVEVYVSHVDSALNFWVQDVAGESQLAEVASAVSEGYGTNEPEEPQEWMKEGAAVVAKYAEDDQWYRGILICVGGDTCKVQFVDYGNADDVSKTNIYPIKPEHVMLPAQAVSCRLDRLNVVEGKEDSAMDALFEMTNEKAVSLEAIEKKQGGKGQYTVTLHTDGADVRDKLVTDGLCILTPGVEGGDQTALVSPDLHAQTGKEVVVVDSEESQQCPKDSILTKLENEYSTPNPYSVIELQEGQRISVHILHTFTPNEFYVQPESSKHSLDELMEGMYEFYNDLAEGDMVVDDPKTGQTCACVYGEDGSWHRAKVCSVKEGNCEVLYVDFGNKETVACSAIRQLPERFIKLPAQSVRCSLAGVRSKDNVWSQEAIALFEELTSNKMLIMDILTVGSDGSCTVHLLHMGLAINKVLLEKNLGVDAATPVPISHKVKRIFSDSSDVATPQKLTFEETGSLKEEDEDVQNEVVRCISSTFDIGERYQVYTSQVMTPDCFYCQLTSSVLELQQLMEQLQTSYTESSTCLEKTQIAVGGYGIARFQEDGQYFRAKVLKQEQTQVVVLLIDYGRTESISVSDLLTLKPDFKNNPCHAFLCRLSEVGHEGENWTEESCLRFKKLVEEKELTAKVVSSLDNKCVDVELFSGGESIGQTLISENLAVVKEENTDAIQKRIESLIEPFPADETVDMTENKVNKTRHEDGFQYLQLVNEKDYSIEVGQDSILDQFILNLTSVTKQVEEMMKEIDKYMDKEGQVDEGNWQPVIGKPCLVRKQTEGQWFRGKLVEIEEETFKVYLVDYREMMRCERDSIRELPPQFLEVPVNGFMCQLADVAPVDGTWSQEAVTHFHDLATDSFLGAFLVSQSEEGIHNVRLHDIDDIGGATINRQLVDLGCAMPLPGSLVEMELQMEQASKDTSVLEDMEQSFHDVSYQRENSLGEESDSAQDESCELGQTFNTTGHSMLDQTADRTHGPDATLELVGEASALEAERDMETPRPQSAGHGAQDVCHGIVEDLVSQTEVVCQAKGQEICKDIVEVLVDKLVTGDSAAEGQEKPEAEHVLEEDRTDGVSNETNKEKVNALDGSNDTISDNDSQLNTVCFDGDEAESDQQKVEEQDEFTECVGQLTGESPESDSADKSSTQDCVTESRAQEGTEDLTAVLVPGEDSGREEGTESDTQEGTEIEDSPECEKDEFYEADDGGATGDRAEGEEDGGPSSQKCGSDTHRDQGDKGKPEEGKKSVQGNAGVENDTDRKEGVECSEAEADADQGSQDGTKEN